MSRAVFMQALEVAIEQTRPGDERADERWLELHEIDRSDFVDTAGAICVAIGERVEGSRWSEAEQRAIVGGVTLALQTGFAAGLSRGFPAP